MNRYEIAVYGEDQHRYRRTLCVEAPADATMDELEHLVGGMFDNVADDPNWKLEYCHGVRSLPTAEIDVVKRVRYNHPVDAKLVRNANGELAVCQPQSCVLEEESTSRKSK